MLRPSISRQQYGTLEEYQECCEVQSLRVHGTLQPAHQIWIETFSEVPPHIADIELDAKAVFDAEDQKGAADEADLSGLYGDLGCRGVVTERPAAGWDYDDTLDGAA